MTLTLAACATSAAPPSPERRLPDAPADCAPRPLPPIRTGMNALVVAAQQRSAATGLNLRLEGCRAAWGEMQALYRGERRTVP